MIQISEQEHEANVEALKVADVLAMQVRLFLDERDNVKKVELAGVVKNLQIQYVSLRAGQPKPTNPVF